MYDNIISAFWKNLESLRDFVDVVSGFLDERSKEDLSTDPDALIPLAIALSELKLDDPLDKKQKNKLLRLYGGDIQDIKAENADKNKDGSIKITLKSKNPERYQKVFDSISKSSARRGQLYQSALISLISTVENFVAQLAHKHFNDNPNAIGIKEKTLSLDDLNRIGSIEDARKYLIDKKVEDVLRGSFTDWIIFIKQKMNVSASYLDRHIDSMAESCQRRNLFIHNGGTVNSIYLQNLPPSIKKRPKINDRLSISSEYLEDTISDFERNFILIAAEIWKKNEPNNEERGSKLIEIAFEHLLKERWQIAGDISYFIAGDKGLSESNRLIGQINYWQCKKWQGELKDVKNEIEELDLSAKEPIFRLAKATLLDSYDEAIELIKLVIKNKVLETDDIKTWPIFQKLRKEREAEILEITTKKTRKKKPSSTRKLTKKTPVKKKSIPKKKTAVKKKSPPKKKVNKRLH